MPVRSQQIIIGDSTPTPIVVPTYGSVGDPITATIRNGVGGILYLGGPDVTTGNGFILRDDEVMSIDVIAGDVLYALVPGGSPGPIYVLKFRQ